MASLRSFIRAVRSGKTIADERVAIRKESAKIRTSFRDPHLDEEHRRKNIQKLLYLYILGEPTYFGQVECLKLLASPLFTNKRLGYLASMLILDENQEILTLLTNSLDNDLKSSNQYITGLALCTLGNIASSELAKDLYTNVESLLNANSHYLRKKAAIVAAKLVKKEPDLSEVFIDKVPVLLKDKSHGVLLSALKLVKEIFLNDETSHDVLRGQVPQILTHLRFLSTTGYSPEYDVKGVPDPFLYVSLLETLRLLLQGDENNPNLESLNDLLTQICSRLENSKGPAHAVLYEAVQTIFAVNSDSSLRVLGVNILSKFLSLKDNNTKYVALNALLNVINYEPLAVQRHRTMIVGCLKDGDISIRRRALELSFAIMNPQNIRMLTKELIKFLSGSDDELKPYITTQLSLACYKYSPSLEWTFDTLIQMLEISGGYFSDDIISSILALVMQNKNTNLTKNAVVHLIKASQVSYTEFGLALVTIWCLGEYGDLALGRTYTNISSETETISEGSEVDLLDKFLNLSTSDDASRRGKVRLYALTAALKLSVRFKGAREVERLRRMIESSKEDINLEIQIRAIEYMEIFGEPGTIKKGLLERMPPPPPKEHEGISLFEQTSSTQRGVLTTSATKDGTNTGNLLLDLLDDEPSDPQQQQQKPEEPSQKTESSTLDILSDIFGDQSIKPTENTSANTIMDILGSSKSENEGESAKIEAFNDGNVSIGFNPEKIGAGEALITCVVKNETSLSIVEEISVLCAVTKHQKLELSPISSSMLRGKEAATLKIKITGKEGAKIKMRIKIGYKIGGDKLQKQFDFAGISDRM
ncbi:hypothetical protein FOA43_001785 [Brettanomyces nanus]|uniref:AP-1 complex subunit gamma n=1 Tax=Eeniella nana TaxID=13502 RepID=A0A875S2A1_EENNA|nr:uncharacterized protein FOA43_001785 [Brettanomyces nanus]QPG74455.1 hypothetical protein FOA43_001785 [Brettanomyces nanus]